MTESFTLAVVGSPFGLKGFVKIKSFSGETGHLASLKNAVLRHKNTEKMFAIEATELLGDPSWILMKFEGINSPEAAKTLTGAELIADRSQAAPLKQGEFYVEDLKGLKVISAEAGAYAGAGAEAVAEVLGHIVDIIEGGGGDLAEVRLLSGETRLVPFRNEFFGSISLENGTAILLEPWILDE